jgi:hypothetical protein
MPTRTFIGLILLVFALMVASTPMLLDPAAAGLQRGLEAAGVPGLTQATIKRDDRAKTGKVTNKLILKGYERGSQDMTDTLPLGDRAVHQPGGRLTAGTHRVLLPGESVTSDPLSPPVEVKGGVLLDGAKCPVFRAGVDVATLWKDPTQQQKYLDKAASADNPTACTALIKNRVAVATNATRTDQPGAMDVNRAIQSNDLGLAIWQSFDQLLMNAFPAYQTSSGSKIRGNLIDSLAR